MLLANPTNKGGHAYYNPVGSNRLWFPCMKFIYTTQHYTESANSKTKPTLQPPTSVLNTCNMHNDFSKNKWHEL